MQILQQYVYIIKSASDFEALFLFGKTNLSYFLK